MGELGVVVASLQLFQALTAAPRAYTAHMEKRYKPMMRWGGEFPNGVGRTYDGV